MIYVRRLGWGLLAGCVCVVGLRADERRFTYVYEPETLPAGVLEFENWVTLRSQRSGDSGQEHYSRWDLRQEFEYGVSDRYTVAFYLNEKAVSYRDKAAGEGHSEFGWEGVSLENRFNVLNPATHAVGLTLYLEGRYAGSEAALEQKIILGQRHGDWKWAFNLEHETEWEDDLQDVEGEVGASLAVARDLGRRWALGLELWNENILPDYQKWESSALFLGPTLSFREEAWWAALSVLPQIYGWNNSESQDGDPHRELHSHEKLNVRFLMGFNF